MLGLDDRLAGLGEGGIALALLAAVLLGLRHATDPDHLTAVSTLVLSDEERGPRRARLLGLAWGAGHALTLVALGLPVVLFGDALPETVHRAAELAVAAVIALLAARLWLRWRRGVLHVHVHEHDGVRHVHAYFHEQPHPPAAGPHARPAHRHAHPTDLGRTPGAAFGIGLVHGVGGSAGVGILLVGSVAGGAPGVVLLCLFAAATACSMALASTAWGIALTRGLLARRLATATPALALGCLAFACWYALGALERVPYPL